jgi:hypothetical protein
LVLGEFEKRNRLLPPNGWEPFQEITERLASFDVVE